MAKVFLRVYNREIESMIEGGQLDEAVAHCQHILKTFPMHVDTYRLLGKAFLEARRYADAADIFERVLMAVPDDFVSHVGMSIIRDDENKMDDAIWHMERAFEVQPSNSAIQGELRRLYGRRDGVEPSKIRLSRDALANMYSQGELFNQAIAEIRSVLAEDTNRPDLQVMLARAYYRSGQKVEAAEMAAALLKKYPYCMDALRVLVDVLPGTARAENTQVYRQRLHNLDPYSSFTVTSVFTSDQVADSAVNLERLEYKSGPTPVSSQPDWASSLGIKLNDEKQADTPPDWMQAAETPEQPAAAALEPSSPLIAPAAAAAAETVPEWMRSAGWQESTKKTTEADSSASGESLPEEPIAKADIPDWLKSMAPTEATAEVNPEPEEPAEALSIGEDGIPDWLKPTGSLNAPGKTHVEVPPPATPEPASASGVPDWLQSMAPVGATDEMHEETPPLPVEPEQAPAEPQPASDETAPDWLQSLAPAESADVMHEETPPLPVEPEQAPAEPQPVSDEAVPDWLQSLAPAESADVMHEETPPLPVEPEQAPAEPQPVSDEAVPDWLESLSPAEPVEDVHIETPVLPVEPAQTPAEPGLVSDEAVPDWLQSLALDEPVQEAHVETPMQPVEPQQAPVEPQLVSEEEVPDWLQSLGAPEAAEEPHVETPVQPVEAEQAPAESLPASEAGEADFPDWLKSLAPTEIGGGVQAQASQPVEPEQTPTEPQPASAAGVASAASATGADEVLDWLKSMESADAAGEIKAEAPQQPVEPEPAPVEPPPASTGGVPDWFTPLAPVQAVEEVPTETPQPPVEPQPVGVDATPDWLKPMTPGEARAEAPQQPAEPQPESEDGIPDWLKSMAPAETAGNSNVVSEPAPAEPVSVESEPGPIPAETPAVKAEAFPDWLTGMGSRADAAALTAQPSKPAVPTEPPVSELPVAPEPPAQAPVEPQKPPASTSAESFQPTGEVKPLNIGDDAFSWLESLAAKQGAKPEELLTNPEERSGEMPDWLRQPGEKPAETPVPTTKTPIRTPAETLPLEPLSRFTAAPDAKLAQPIDLPLPAKPVEPVMPVMEEKPSSTPLTETPTGPVVEPVSGEDATKAWLEQMAAGEETKPEEPAVSPVEDLGTPPDWLKKMPEDQAAATAPEKLIPAAPEPVPAEEDISITSWLNKLDAEDAFGKKSGEVPAEAVPVSAADELPDWLKNLEKPVAPAEAPKTENDLPEWLRHPIPSEEPETVSTKPLSAPEPELPAWVDEGASITGQAAPTMPDEWLPAEAKAEGIPDFLQSAEPAPVSEPMLPIEAQPGAETPPGGATMPPAESTPVSGQPPVRMPSLKQTGMLSHVSVLDKDAELLSSAQNVLDQNSLDDAMKKYTKLIKKGRLLDEVIHDLREAIYRYPVDVIVWQTLGDAYMRANRLQDALDAYTKAEELLR